MRFNDLADEYCMNLVNKELEDLGFTMEEVAESVAARVVVNTLNIQYLTKNDFKYKESNLVTSKKLFKI